MNYNNGNENHRLLMIEALALYEQGEISDTQWKIIASLLMPEALHHTIHRLLDPIEQSAHFIQTEFIQNMRAAVNTRRTRDKGCVTA